jgi:dTDP-4-dehydrorhamnose reductase
MIWVIGNRGMLGQEVSAALAQAGIEHSGTDREVDFTDPAALRAWHAEQSPRWGSRLDWIINCAAYTAVDKSEDEPDLCHRLNVDGPAAVAAFAQENGCAFIHISTDYVFDGQGIPGADGKRRPYREGDPVGPQGTYGRTKAEGEEAVRRLCHRHLIVRTAWLYGLNGPNFVYTMLKLMSSRDTIGVVADQWGSPTWAYDLATALVGVMALKEVPFGTYHFTDEGVTNWHQFAAEIHRIGRQSGLLGREVTINALTTEQYPTKAKRPAWSVLDKTKIKESAGARIPDWQSSLAAFMRLIADGADEPAITKYWRT